MSETVKNAGNNASKTCEKAKLALQYEKPILRNYGDVRDVTLGPTAGVGESGCQNSRRVNPDVVGC